MPVPLFVVALNAAPIFVGSWSVTTLLCMLASVSLGVILLVVLIVTGLSGGFARKTTAQPDTAPMAGSLSAAYREAAREIAAERAGLAQNALYGASSGQPIPPAGAAAQNAAPGSAASQAPPAPPPTGRRTGLWQLLAALACCVPSVMVWAWVDSPRGASTAFTLGAALNLIVLAGQVLLTVWYVRLRKRL